MKKISYVEIRTFSDKFVFRISLDGILFLENFYVKEEQIFISLTVDVLNFLKKVQDRTIELYPGEGNQIGSIPTPEFLNIIGIIGKEKQAKL